MNRILRFLLLSCLFSGCSGLLAAQEITERFFIDMVETYGVPEGVGELTGTQAKKQNHYRFQYDKAGRVVRVESRDPAGCINPDFFHVRTLTFEYGEDGSLLRRVWRSPEDAVDLVWRYDGRDRIIFEDAFLGELPPLDFMPFRDGLLQDLSHCIPGLTACGNLAGLSLSRDEKGRVVRVDFLRADGAQGFDSLETGGHRYERDELGRFTRAVLLNGKGQPHADYFGVSEYRLRYDGNYLAELGCYGIDGKPVNNNRGFAFLRQEFPEPELCRTSFFGVRGEPVTDRQDGYSFSILRTRFDGRDESISFFGPDGLPCAGLYGAARVDFFYPDKNTEEIRKTPAGGAAVRGFPRIRIIRNDCGRVVRMEFFADESDRPREVWIDSLSDRGLLTEREIRKAGAGLVQRIRELRRDDGALSARIVTDAEGRVEREEHFEYDRLGNTLKYYDTSFGGIRQEQDEHGRFVKEIILDKDGKDTKQITTVTFDGSGRPETKTVVSEDPDSPPSPARKTVFTRDAQGNPVREAYFGEDGKPLKDGLAVILREFDDRGNETLVRGLTSAGAPALLPDESYAERKQTFDQRDNVSAVIWLDCDLVPVFQPFPAEHPFLDSFWAAIARMQYDSANELIRAELFPEDETGFPSLPGTASIRVSRSLLPRGEELHVEFFDLSGGRACPYGGSASVLRLREEVGKLQITLLDGNMEKTMAPELGYAEEIFDPSEGDSPRYYDAEGNPVTPPSDEEDSEEDADGEENEGPEKAETGSPEPAAPEENEGPAR